MAKPLPKTIFIQRTTDRDGVTYLTAYESAAEIPEDEDGEKFTQYSRGAVVTFHVQKSVACRLPLME